MDDDTEVTDILDWIGGDDSDVASSEDEYVPRESDLSESEEEEVGPSTSKGPNNNPRAKRKRKHVALSDDSEDDVPLSVLRQKLNERREQEDIEIISQMLEEPMWDDVPMAHEDTSFKGIPEEAPQHGLKTPYEYFRDLITDNMLDNVANQSNHYALVEHGIELKTTRKEIEIFIGLYLRMGLTKGHSVRAYWASETRYPLVADEMSRNRFEVLAQNIHFVDNTSVSVEEKADKIWKVRTWVEGFRENLARITPQQKQSIDEVMVAFKGRSGLKQYLRNKPRKWGFKLWARAGCDGIVHDFDIYQGKRDDQTNKSGLGMMGDVVIDMVKKLPEHYNFIIYADNLFSSLQLVKELKKKGFLFVGTVRENRLKGCELKTEKVLKKEKRGAMDSKVELNSNVVVVRWYDNRKVDLISSCVGVEPVQKTKRYDKKTKQNIEVDCPFIVQDYNQHMGGVDLLDSLTSLYKYSIKSRRWYLYIFFHTINMAVVNSWLVYRRHFALLQVNGSHIQLSSFQSQAADGLIHFQRKQGRPSDSNATPTTNKRPNTVEHRPNADVRFDQTEHFPQWGARGRCKAVCPGFTFVYCVKCKLHLCFNKDRNCFTNYHNK